MAALQYHGGSAIPWRLGISWYLGITWRLYDSSSGPGRQSCQRHGTRRQAQLTPYKATDAVWGEGARTHGGVSETRYIKKPTEPP